MPTDKVIITTSSNQVTESDRLTLLCEAIYNLLCQTANKK